MGVSGSGKTSVGKLLGKKMNLPFYDADDFHPRSNIEKMANGFPLNDDDRWPWLDELGKQIKCWEAKGGAVLACSALKQIYRERLTKVSNKAFRFIYLSGSFNLIKKRLVSRKNHFFDENLLQSQFETLEIPTDAIHVSIEESTDQITNHIINQLKKDEPKI